YHLGHDSRRIRPNALLPSARARPFQIKSARNYSKAKRSEYQRIPGDNQQHGLPRPPKIVIWLRSTSQRPKAERSLSRFLATGRLCLRLRKRNSRIRLDLRTPSWKSQVGSGTAHHLCGTRGSPKGSRCQNLCRRGGFPHQTPPRKPGSGRQRRLPVSLSEQINERFRKKGRHLPPFFKR